jgi:RNA polymerase sigma factor (TIGR02999 family)
MSQVDITHLLKRASGGDRAAIEELTPHVQAELRRLAEAQMKKERAGHTLQPTSLVNEAFLRLFGTQVPSFTDRAHFLIVAARVMRRILVDHARKRSALKRGFGLTVPMEEFHAASSPKLVDLLAIDEALERLAARDARLARLVEMRFFAGMTAEEAAAALGESVHVVKHDLRYAQAWMRSEFEPPRKEA